jgi:hypothetical protein
MYRETVEKVGMRGRAAFTNRDELWEIGDAGTEGRAKMGKVKDGPEKGMSAKGQKLESQAGTTCS